MQPSPLWHALSGQSLCVSQLIASAHVTSHEHASRQSTPPHARWPEQVTVHGPEPHRTLSHAVLPEHVTVHEVAPLQSTSRHSLPPQSTMQSQPLGHVALPFGLVAPSMRQIMFGTSHVEHAGGHCDELSTQ